MSRVTFITARRASWCGGCRDRIEVGFTCGVTHRRTLCHKCAKRIAHADARDEEAQRHAAAFAAGTKPAD